jgi:hypothetical protein
MVVTASVPVFIVLVGYHHWRRICPSAFVVHSNKSYRRPREYIMEAAPERGTTGQLGGRRRPVPAPSPSCLLGEPSALQMLYRHAGEIGLEIEDRGAIQHIDAAHL